MKKVSLILSLLTGLAIGQLQAQTTGQSAKRSKPVADSARNISSGNDTTKLGGAGKKLNNPNQGNGSSIGRDSGFVTPGNGNLTPGATGTKSGTINTRTRRGSGALVLPPPGSRPASGSGSSGSTGGIKGTQKPGNSTGGPQLQGSGNSGNSGSSSGGASGSTVPKP